MGICHGNAVVHGSAVSLLVRGGALSFCSNWKIRCTGGEHDIGECHYSVVGGNVCDSGEDIIRNL